MDPLDRLEAAVTFLETYEQQQRVLHRRVQLAQTLLENSQQLLDQALKRMKRHFMCSFTDLRVTCPHCNGFSFHFLELISRDPYWIRSACKQCHARVKSTMIILPE